MTCLPTNLPSNVAAVLKAARAWVEAGYDDASADAALSDAVAALDPPATTVPYAPREPTERRDYYDTLADAKDALFLALARGDGVQCPCCEQHARVWRRVLGSTIAGPLRDIYNAANEARDAYRRACSFVECSACAANTGSPRLCADCLARRETLDANVLPGNSPVDLVIGYVDVRRFGYRGGDYSKGAHWNLLAAHPTRANVFNLTDLGVAFVEGKTTVPRYAHIYNDGLIGFSEERTDIATALGTAFSVDEMKTSK